VPADELPTLLKTLKDAAAAARLIRT